MGYKPTARITGEAKREATQEQREQIGALLDCSPNWHKRALQKVGSYCTKLGYDKSGIQSPAEWLDGFANELLQSEHWSERKSILPT